MKKLIQILSVIIFVTFTFKANAQTTYTYTGVGNFNSVTSWTTTAGANPSAMPTGSADIFQINTSTSIGATSWTVTAGSSIIIGDGVNSITFNTGTSTTNIVSDGGPDQSLSLTVSNNATLIILTADFFTDYIGTTSFLTGSTVDYSLINCIVANGDYYNFTLSHDATLNGNTITVSNTFNNTSILSFYFGTITLYGTVTGTGSFLGDVGSIIDIESGGAITLNFKPGSQKLNTLIIGSGSTVTLNTDLLISGFILGTYNNNYLDQSGGSLNLNGHTLTLDKNNDATFGTGSNVITGSASSGLIIKSASYNSGGSSANLNMDQTSSSTSSLRTLILNGSTFCTLNLANNLNITDSICPTSGFLTTSGNLTLIANQTTPGKVGRIGVVSGSITGNVTSQVFHNPPANQTNWILMGSAGIDSPTFNDWYNNFVITCPSCPITTVNGAVFNSVQTYAENSGTTFGDPAHYSAIGGLSSTINPGEGYWVYLGTANPGATIPGKLISITGLPKVGSINVNLTNSNTSDLTNYGYNLIANPYPSTISWKKVINANGLGSSAPENNVYAYSPSYNGGDYVIYNANTGVSNPPLGSTYAIGNQIPSGLGFYVQTDQSTRTLSFNENVKTNNTINQILFKGANQANNVDAISTSPTHYFNLQVTGGNNESWASVAFNADATASFDGFDAMALGYNNLLQISTSSASSLGKDYAINGMPDLIQNYTIPVKILSGTTSQYQINPTNLENMVLGACLNLHDNYTNLDYNLRNGSFNVTINDTETVARFVLQVTVSPLAITTTATQETCINKYNGFITAVGNTVGPWNYVWKDANGTIIKTSLNKASEDSLTSINNGVFTVEVNTAGSCDAGVQTFTLVSAPLLTSEFTAPTQVSVGSLVTFTNTSSNGTSYSWSFGDGNTASQQSPTYTYNNTGLYNVILTVVNSACNDTARTSQPIIVDAASTTGIKSIAGNANNIFLSKDATGSYLQFNYANQTKVNITVYNVLGQTLLNNAGLNVVTDKIYLNVNDSKNQVLYVTITDLTTNQQTTKKFINN